MNTKITQKEMMQQTNPTGRAGEAEPEWSDREEHHTKADGQFLSDETKHSEET
jgi:hypothetical protein